MYEEMFGGEMDVVEVLDEIDNEKSQARQHRDWLHNKDMEKLRKMVTTLEKMESFSETKKNMFLPIRDGMRVALQTMEMLKTSMENRVGYLKHFEYHFRVRMVSKIKEAGSPKSKEVVDEDSQTLPQPATSTLDPHKRSRDPRASLEDQKTKNRGRRGRKPLTKRRGGRGFRLGRTPRRRNWRRKTRKHRRGVGVHAQKQCS